MLLILQKYRTKVILERPLDPFGDPFGGSWEGVLALVGAFGTLLGGSGPPKVRFWGLTCRPKPLPHSELLRFFAQLYLF